jgi:hypothetical protein
MAKKTLDTLLNEFTEAWNAGERPRVDDYVARAPAAERDELAGLIGAFLELAPTPEYTKEQLREIQRDPLVQQVGNLLDSRSGLWPTLLPRLRAGVKLTRDQLVQALARAVGVQGREAKVKEYYHQMETGQLDPRGVSRRVLEALAGIYKVNVSEIEEAGDFSIEGRPKLASAYFRSYSAAEMAREGVDFDADAAPPAELDEVDRLFIGGR